MHILRVEQKQDALQAEARVVISRIQALLNTPRDSQQPDGPKYRYRDMTILMSEVANSGPQLA